MSDEGFKNFAVSGKTTERGDVISSQDPFNRLNGAVQGVLALCATEIGNGDLVPFEDHESYARAMRNAARLLDAAALIHEDAAARNRAEFFGGAQ